MNEGKIIEQGTHEELLAVTAFMQIYITAVYRKNQPTKYDWGQYQRWYWKAIFLKPMTKDMPNDRQHGCEQVKYIHLHFQVHLPICLWHTHDLSWNGNIQLKHGHIDPQSRPCSHQSPMEYAHKHICSNNRNPHIPKAEAYNGYSVSPAPRRAPARVNCVDCPSCDKAKILRTITAMVITYKSEVYNRANNGANRRNIIPIIHATSIDSLWIMLAYCSAFSGFHAPKLCPTKVVQVTPKAILGDHVSPLILIPIWWAAKVSVPSPDTVFANSISPLCKTNCSAEAADQWRKFSLLSPVYRQFDLVPAQSRTARTKQYIMQSASNKPYGSWKGGTCHTQLRNQVIYKYIIWIHLTDWFRHYKTWGYGSRSTHAKLPMLIVTAWNTNLQHNWRYYG